MRTNIKNKRGISLIVLVLTIIVMIILATAIILSISNSGIIGRSNEAKIKSDIKTMQEELQVLKANNILEGKDDEITIDKLSSAKGYDGKFDIQDGELKFVRAGLSAEEIAIAEEMDIKPYATVLKDGENGVTISDTKAISVVDASAFKLEDVIIPEGVLKTDVHSFDGHSTLTSVSLPTSLTYLGYYSFSGTSLESVIIPESVTTFDPGVFSGCKKLTYVSLPKGLTSLAQGTFAGCSSLESLSMPDGIISIGSRCFEGCKSLRAIDLPAGLTSLGEWAFKDCTSLESIVIPGGISSIEERTFYQCSSLSSVTISNGVNSVGLAAFSGCVGLTSIVIPSSVSTIEGHPFWGCTSLKNITIEGTARFDADDVKGWLSVSDLSDITITGSGYVSE